MKMMTVALSVVVLSVMCSMVVAQDDKLRPCHYEPRFLLRTFRVIVKIKPAEGMEWNFPEAPSVIARRLLDDLNQNADWASSKDFEFEEASGQEPDFIINVTVTETHEGTRQISLEAVVEGVRNLSWIYNREKPSWKESVRQFSVKSADFPFTNLPDAIDALSKNLARWFENGWTVKPPCWDFDAEKGYFIRRS